MKILYVLPSDDVIYGSGRCIAQMAKDIDEPFDLLVGKSLVKKIDEDKLRKAFGKKIGKIYKAWLPNFNAYYGKGEGFLMAGALLHKYIMWIKDRRTVHQIFYENKYDIIHLNSMILLPMLSNKYNMLLHIREVFQGNDKERNYASKMIHKASGIIYINPSTKKAMNVHHANEIIIQDPFDMTKLKDIDIGSIKKFWHIDSDKIVYAILGRFEDRNGTEFIIDAFHNNHNPNTVLFVVGNVSQSKIAEMKDKTENDGRIIYTGELSDPSEVFAITDYVLRGERFFSGFSRTVYEGLYSGARIIFPGERYEAEDSLQYDEFKNSLIFYEPRNKYKLAGIIENGVKIKQSERKYLSNKEIYTRDYLDFIKNIVGKSI